MITSVRLTNFKNFADETLKLGPFTVIVGANASGKSNIRDAFRFLHGIGRGYSLAEIIGGKIGVGGQLEWGPIRGAPNEIVRKRIRGQQRGKEFTLSAELELDGDSNQYSISVTYDGSHERGFLVTQEALFINNVRFFEISSSTFSYGSQISGEELVSFPNPLKPVLTQIRFRPSNQLTKPNSLDDISVVPREIHAMRENLATMRFYQLEPEIVKKRSVPGATIGDFGQNLPSALRAICDDSTRKDAIMAWVRELTPLDVRDFRFPHDPDGNIYLEIVEANNRKLNARSASDGTLRFLAMLAVLINGGANELYFFEEIDNGIHPSRLSLLVELIESQTKNRRFQVVTTTHSPHLLEVLGDESFNNTSVVYRDEESADSIIRNLPELSIASELRKTQGLARLHSSGWMENVLGFEHDPEEKTAPVT